MEISFGIPLAEANVEWFKTTMQNLFPEEKVNGLYRFDLKTKPYFPSDAYEIDALTNHIKAIAECVKNDVREVTVKKRDYIRGKTMAEHVTVDVTIEFKILEEFEQRSFELKLMEGTSQ